MEIASLDLLKKFISKFTDESIIIGIAYMYDELIIALLCALGYGHDISECNLTFESYMKTDFIISVLFSIENRLFC